MHELVGTLQDLWHTVHTNGFESLGPVSYVLIAILVATEGPITTLIGSAGAAAGYLDIRFVFLATAIGNIAGDTLWYSLGYISKTDRLHKVTARVGIHQHHIEQMQDEMNSHAIKAILVSKVTFGLIIPTLVAAGFARVPLRKWLPAVLFAETLWTILLVALGYHAAGAIAQVENGFRIIGLIAVVSAVSFILFYVKRKRYHVSSTHTATTRSYARPLSDRVTATKASTNHHHPTFGQTGQHRRPVTPGSAHQAAQLLEKA